MHLDEVCRQTAAHRYGGRVAIGHVTKLSSLPADAFAAAARKLKDAGVAVTVLPATDLFLMGRGHDHDIPRGVTRAHRLLEQGVNCSIATNNVLNPFTPFGDCSLLRIANLYANIAQAGSPTDMQACFDLVTTKPAQLMNLRDYGIAVGNPADPVVVDAHSSIAALAEINQTTTGFKRGQRTFIRPLPTLSRP